MNQPRLAIYVAIVLWGANMNSVRMKLLSADFTGQLPNPMMLRISHKRISRHLERVMNFQRT